MVKAHFEILRHLQEGRLTALSVCLFTPPPPGAIDRVRRLPIPADFWVEDWEVPTGPGTMVPAGVVPDYAASCLMPFLDVALRKEVRHTAIEFDVRELLECLRRNHSQMFAGLPAPAA
jgi:hypothetical protein